jgi:DNA-binding NarL/FixJ family response regulator
MTLRCVIVDDSPAVLRAATGLLEGQGVAVVGTATTSANAVSLTERHDPDVVLVDIDLGPESGFDLARTLAHTFPGTASRIILISTHDEVDYADLIAASPAIGFLPKSDLSARAIHRVLDRTYDE